jgi:hypothetical protein
MLCSTFRELRLRLFYLILKFLDGLVLAGDCVLEALFFFPEGLKL